MLSASTSPCGHLARVLELLDHPVETVLHSVGQGKVCRSHLVWGHRQHSADILQCEAVPSERGRDNRRGGCVVTGDIWVKQYAGHKTVSTRSLNCCPCDKPGNQMFKNGTRAPQNATPPIFLELIEWLWIATQTQC